MAKARYPNQLVDELRSLSKKIESTPPFQGGEVYFPPKEGDETQPIRLSGYVSVKDVAELLYYIADMLEV